MDVIPKVTRGMLLSSLRTVPANSKHSCVLQGGTTEPLLLLEKHICLQRDGWLEVSFPVCVFDLVLAIPSPL